MAFTTYKLSSAQLPVGTGATDPVHGEVSAIIKRDSVESRAQVYCEAISGILAAMVGVQVTAGVFVAHSNGLRYASLVVEELGFKLTDIDEKNAAVAATEYPAEAAKLAVFDAWICNTDRSGNLRANLARSVDRLMIGIDHGGSLLSVADKFDEALNRLHSIDWPPSHLFAGKVRRGYTDEQIGRIQNISDDAIIEACVLNDTIGSVMFVDQAELVEALKWRRDNLEAIVEKMLRPR